MSDITIKAYAKVNLCLDVLGNLEGGYHEVAMVLQQIDLHDDVSLTWQEDADPEKTASGRGLRIELTSSRPDIPTDSTNLAWKAAEEMAKVLEAGAGSVGAHDAGLAAETPEIDRAGETDAGPAAGAPRGRLRIDIEKRIPMAAGLAGGSSDCAAVIHGLNVLWKMNMSLEYLCRIGARLGSDVPFCVIGQAAADPKLREIFAEDPGASHCAIATGRGTDLEPVRGLESPMVLAKPDIEVSTKEVYSGIDEMVIGEHPDMEEMRRGLEQKDRFLIEKNMVNVLEKFTLKAYPLVVYTKDKVQDLCNGPVLMSGSGPTIYCLCESPDEADRICRELKAEGIESYRTGTTF